MLPQDFEKKAHIESAETISSLVQFASGPKSEDAS